MKHIIPAVSAIALLTLAGACAQAGDTSFEAARGKVIAAMPTLKAENITPSASPELLQIQRGSDFGYVTKDGRYFIHGDMVDLATKEEVTENLRNVARLAVLKPFGPDEVIEFAPKDPKFMVTVFTDVDCGYCRRLHSQIGEYEASGIGIRYMFYPRSGPNTESFTKAEQVWCSADRKAALTMAKQGGPLMGNANCPNPIQKQYDAGEALGINATPMLVLPDGEIVRGYLPPEQLLAHLMQKQAAKKG
jgi:thiol:disulfide interchange protein DsbC